MTKVQNAKIFANQGGQQFENSIQNSYELSYEGIVRFNLKLDEVAYLNLEINQGFVNFEIYSTGSENYLN